MNVAWRRACILVGALIVADQVALYGWLRGGSVLGRPIAPFAPPIFNDAQRASLARLEAAASDGTLPGQALRWDAELGWSPRPGASDATGAYDSLGARIGAAPIAATKAPGVRRLAVLGCSFVHGDEVGGAECWPALVDASRADVEVANLGVGGYGIDQALLRWKRDGEAVGADEVWLGVMPYSLLRIVSVYRPALRHVEPSVSFKPRFRLDDSGALALVPNPAPAIGHALRLLRDARAFETALASSDFFVAREVAAYAPEFSRPSHFSALGRLWITANEGRTAARDPEPYLADPSSEPFRLAVAIAKEMARGAGERGARFRVVVLPDRKSLVRREAFGGVGFWQSFVDALQSAGIAVTDVSDALDRAGASTDDSMWMPQGHYAPKAHRIVAAALAPLAAPN